MACALVSIEMREDTALHSFHLWRPVAWIGELSCGIYLYHLIALHIANLIFGMIGFPDLIWPLFLAYCLITAAFIEVSFRTPES